MYVYLHQFQRMLARDQNYEWKMIGKIRHEIILSLLHKDRGYHYIFHWFNCIVNFMNLS